MVSKTASSEAAGYCASTALLDKAIAIVVASVAVLNVVIVCSKISCFIIGKVPADGRRP